MSVAELWRLFPVPKRALRMRRTQLQPMQFGLPHTLLSILDLVSGGIWKSTEAAAISARLVRLLPQPGQAAAETANAATGTAIAATGTAKVSAQRTNYWWVWLGFWLVMSFMMPHHQATTPNTGAVTSESGAPSQLKSNPPDPLGLSR